MIARRATRRFRRGFTLIEAIATIVILGAIGSMTSMMIANSVDGYAAATTSAQLHTEASVAMDRIVRALRNIQLDTTASGNAPDIDDVTATSMTWNPTSSLSLSGTQLNLEVDGAGSVVILEDVTALSIQTFDESNAALSASLTGDQCDDIQRVEIEFTISRQSESETLRSKIFLRCMMTAVGS